MHLPFTAESVAVKTIAQMEGGVDYFMISIALLIFGYGFYELVISDFDQRLEGGEEQAAHQHSLGEQSPKPEKEVLQ